MKMPSPQAIRYPGAASAGRRDLSTPRGPPAAPPSEASFFLLLPPSSFERSSSLTSLAALSPHPSRQCSGRYTIAL